MVWLDAPTACAKLEVAMAVQYHQGCRWPLVRDVLLPALGKETAAVLRCGTLTGGKTWKGKMEVNIFGETYICQ